MPIPRDWSPTVSFWQPTPETNKKSFPQINIATPAGLRDEFLEELKQQSFWEKLTICCRGLSSAKKWPVDYGDLEASVGLWMPNEVIIDFRNFVIEFARSHELPCGGLTNPVLLTLEFPPEQ